MKSIAPDSANLICDDLQAAVDQWRDRTAMTFEGRTVSYAELEAAWKASILRVGSSK